MTHTCQEISQGIKFPTSFLNVNVCSILPSVITRVKLCLECGRERAALFNIHLLSLRKYIRSSYGQRNNYNFRFSINYEDFVIVCIFSLFQILLSAATVPGSWGELLFPQLALLFHSPSHCCLCIFRAQPESPPHSCLL